MTKKKYNNNQNLKKRIFAGKEINYFTNYLNEIKYFIDKKIISKENEIYKMSYPIYLMPLNSIFIYKNNKYLFNEYDNINEKVNVIDFIKDKMVKLNPLVIGERVIDLKIQFYYLNYQ